MGVYKLVAVIQGVLLLLWCGFMCSKTLLLVHYAETDNLVIVSTVLNFWASI